MASLTQVFITIGGIGLEGEGCHVEDAVVPPLEMPKLAHAGEGLR